MILLVIAMATASDNFFGVMESVGAKASNLPGAVRKLGEGEGVRGMDRREGEGRGEERGRGRGRGRRKGGRGGRKEGRSEGSPLTYCSILPRQLHAGHGGKSQAHERKSGRLGMLLDQRKKLGQHLLSADNLTVCYYYLP